VLTQNHLKDFLEPRARRDRTGAGQDSIDLRTKSVGGVLKGVHEEHDLELDIPVLNASQGQHELVSFRELVDLVRMNFEGLRLLNVGKAAHQDFNKLCIHLGDIHLPDNCQHQKKQGH